MAQAPLRSFVRRLHEAARLPHTGLSDRELLTRFATAHDEAAFRALVDRHGPLVLGVCRRLLRQEQDAEDVFQATFLILARKAASVRWRESVGNWLHEVAYRLAAEARGKAARRRVRERHAAATAPKFPTPDPGLGELCDTLDEELYRLPEQYRLPLLLCYLEGQTRDQAARHLGWSLRTLHRRLERGREILRVRLTRRGVALSCALLAAGLAQTATVPVPAVLRLGTVETVRLAMSGGALGVASSARAVVLAEAFLRGAAVGKVKVLAVLVLTLGMIVAGTGVLTRQTLVAGPPAASASGSAKATVGQVRTHEWKSEPKPRTDRYGDPLPPGALARLGTTRFRQGFFTYDAAFSPDGKLIASACAGRGLCVWDAVTGKQLHRLGDSTHGYAVAFSPDGKLIAGGGTDGVRLWDAATGALRRELPDSKDDVVFHECFSPDGRTLATDRLGAICLWDVASGRMTQQLKGFEGRLIKAMIFLPGGKTLAIATAGEDKDNSIHLWDLATGKESRVLPKQREMVLKLVVEPAGKRLISGGWDGTIRVWDPASGNELRVVKAGHHHVTSLAVSGDGRTLVSGHSDGTIVIWDAERWREVRHWRAGTMTVMAANLSPDGKRLVSGGSWEPGPRLWDVATGKPVHHFAGHHGVVDWLTFSPDGKALYSEGRDKQLLHWDLPGGRDHVALHWESDGFDHALLSPNGRSAATWGYTDNTVRLWDVASGKGRRLLDGMRSAAGNPPVHPLAFSPDSKLLAAADKAPLVHLWDVASGKEVHRFRWQAGKINGVEFAPDGKTLAAAAERTGGATVILWDVATGKDVRSLAKTGHGYCLAFSPDGKLLATASVPFTIDARVQVWDLATGREVRPLVGGVPGAYMVTFSPDGRFLAAAGDDKDQQVHVWEVATGQRVYRFEGHQACVSAVAFSPDGRALASGGGDSTIYLWDLTGRAAPARHTPGRLTRAELETFWIELAGADAAVALRAVWDLAFSPGEAVPFLERRLRPPAPVDAGTLAQWISDLDSPRFTVRQKATTELKKLGDLAAPALRQALAGKPSLEMRERIEQLLGRLESATSPVRLRELRSVQALEYAGTPEARQLLRRLAGRGKDSTLGREAETALRRLGAPR
jgi:RNA polymerase sigma factor (sigma-70 family)